VATAADREAPAATRSQQPGGGAAARASLRIGGFTPLSTTDYPGALAAVVFCQGCPWRCGYCHNPHLLPAHGRRAIDWIHVVRFLARRQWLLDAVVISGGEPLAQRALPAAMREVKKMGYRIGLHTGGAYPERLRAVLPHVDWIGFDVKAPFDAYASITGAPRSGEPARASLSLVLASGVQYEVRTTVHPRMLGAAAVESLAMDLSARGVRNYVLQDFRSTGCADERLAGTARDDAIAAATARRIAPLFATFDVRRG